MAKQNDGKKGVDKKRKNRSIHSGKPRITKSREKRRRGPLHIHMAEMDTLKRQRTSVADQATIDRYIPNEQAQMLQAKYAGEEPIQRYVQAEIKL